MPKYEKLDERFFHYCYCVDKWKIIHSKLQHEHMNTPKFEYNRKCQLLYLNIYDGKGI